MQDNIAAETFAVLMVVRTAPCPVLILCDCAEVVRIWHVVTTDTLHTTPHPVWWGEILQRRATAGHASGGDPCFLISNVQAHVEQGHRDASLTDSDLELGNDQADTLAKLGVSMHVWPASVVFATK